MPDVELGRAYKDGTLIFREEEPGDCMYYITRGQVRISKTSPKGEVYIATLGEGEIFGEIALFDRHPRSATATAVGETRLLTLDKNKFFASFSRDPTLAFKILEAMSTRIRRLNNEYAKTVNRMFDVLSVAPDLERVCALILDEASQAVKADNGSIMLLGKDGETLTITAAFGEEQPEKLELTVGEGVAGKVVESGQVQMINNVSLSPIYKPGKQAINSIICVPLVSEERQLGVLNLSSITDKAFSMHDLKLIQLLTSYSAIALQSALDFEGLKEATETLTSVVEKMAR